MELKLYRCAHCGNIIFKVVDKGVPVMCCGQKMEELVPNTTDGAMEKHVPVVERTAHGSGYSVSVKVGSVAHPMQPEHWINLIAAVSGDTVTIPSATRTRHFPHRPVSPQGKLSIYPCCRSHRLIRMPLGQRIYSSCVSSFRKAQDALPQRRQSCSI